MGEHNTVNGALANVMIVRRGSTGAADLTGAGRQPIKRCGKHNKVALNLIGKQRRLLIFMVQLLVGDYDYEYCRCRM